MGLKGLLSAALKGGHPDIASGDRLMGVITHTDARCRVFSGPEADERAAALKAGKDSHNPGDLHTDFETNPATDVTEVLLTHLFEADLVGGVKMTRVLQNYRLAEGGKLAWETPSMNTDMDPSYDHIGNKFAKALAGFFDVNGGKEVQ